MNSVNDSLIMECEVSLCFLPCHVYNADKIVTLSAMDQQCVVITEVSLCIIDKLQNIVTISFL